MSNHSLDLDIRVNGKTIRQYSHDNRLYIEAKQGSEYTIHVSNHNHERVLVVATVDGINVLNGQAGGKTKAGYVVNGYSNVAIKGFRTSDDSVNAFKFSAKSRSYAAKSDETGGDTSNCGVIGIQVFAEKPTPPPITIVKEFIPFNMPIPVPPWRPDYMWTSCRGLGDTYNSQGTMSSSSMNQLKCSSLDNSLPRAAFNVSTFTSQLMDNDMGTEWSKNAIEDKVKEVEFETGRLLTTFVVYYASRESLLDLGVPLTNQTQVSFPEPFPSKFCKPPR